MPERTNAKRVVDYFGEHFGPVSPLSLIEIVPTRLPSVAIHAIPPGDGRDHLTLFTSGMSELPMSLPPDADPAYRYAELFIQLPGSWDYRALEDPDQNWPNRLMRQIAALPHEHKTWLGGPVTIYAEAEPPTPLSPNTDFTSLLLLAERQVEIDADACIQLYRVMPLYTEERQLEIDEGVGALMRAMDTHSTPFVVKPGRPSVA